MKISSLNHGYSQSHLLHTSQKNDSKLSTDRDLKSDTYIPSNPKYSIGMNNLPLDKGTAIATTIHIDRNNYNQILYAAVNGPNKPSEFGVDMDKRWVVIDGQRFECELSPEEKRLKRGCQKTLLDYIFEDDDKKKKEDSKTITKTEDIKSTYLTKRYGSPEATPDKNDIVLQVLQQAGLA
ncbi:hypothetical protein SAMN02745248_01275 [Hathewaya proteolytica DSM 3090]|uniref:Uncharacterized protein n=1 Tax=Hathewaya proteolytica DSM 3090 TaxID=1121331 RepID=A0A1M6N5C0_9CLOT|nr:hypothetical protein [Hathewaya proteolytica]SHJ90891.1 hypothetical protein SAMN02745248_01275 [Hathewaya proteolytica DSM 3090]